MTARLLLAAALYVLPAIGVRADEVSAQVGVVYVRTTLSPEQGPEQTLPHLDVDLRLDAKGFYERRGMFDWNLGVGYRRLSDEAGGLTNRRSLLTYAGGFVLNGNERAPLKTTVNVSRLEHRFTSDAGSNVFGDGISNFAGVVASSVLPNRQVLTLGYSRTDVTDNVPLMAPHEFTNHGLSGNLKFGQEGFNVVANYRGTLKTGTWDTDRTDDHAAAISASARVAGNMVLQLQDNYFLQEPHYFAPGLSRVERNDFSLSALNARPNGERQIVQYLFLRHYVQSSPGSSTEAMRQSLRWNGDYRLDGVESPALVPENDRRFFVRAILDGSYNETSNPLVPNSWAETAGAELFWYRQEFGNLMELRGGPLASAAQVDGGSQRLGYGARGGARIGRPWNNQTIGLNYSIDFGDRLYGGDSWFLQQDLYATMTGPLGPARYNLYARAGAVRTRSAAVGDGASRSLEARAGAQHRLVNAEAVAIFTDGFALTSAQQTITGDGLFIPTPYNSHVRDLTFRFGFTPVPGLKFEATARSVASDVVGQPSVHETEVRGAVDYQFGGLAAGVENRVVWYDQNGGGQTSYLMFRLYRRLGFRT